MDRLVVREGVRTRLADSVDTALKWGDNRLIVLRQQRGMEQEVGGDEILHRLLQSGDRISPFRSSRRSIFPSTAIWAPARPATASARSSFSTVI